MKTMNYKKFFSRLLLVAALPVMLGLASCKEDIDESNLYTFTGETIEDFLVNRSDQYSSFNYILSRVGYDKILSAYGTYTCFAPNNKAIEEYIDSLYDDTSNKDFEHNGMTSRGLEGLSLLPHAHSVAETFASSIDRVRRATTKEHVSNTLCSTDS